MPDRPKTFRPIGWTKPKDTRPSAAKRGYGYKWDKARKRYLAKNPLCVYCRRYHDRVRPATCVDHIIPHKGDPGLFWGAAHKWAAVCKQWNCIRGERGGGGGYFERPDRCHMSVLVVGGKRLEALKGLRCLSARRMAIERYGAITKAKSVRE